MHDTHKLPLGCNGLQMETAKHVALRRRYIVLNKRPDACRPPLFAIPVPRKRAPVIRKRFKTDHFDLRNICLNQLHNLSRKKTIVHALEFLQDRSMIFWGGRVKIRVQTTIGIQCSAGVFFGTTDWIKGRTVQLRSPVTLQDHDEFMLKLELPNGGEWILGRARVLKTAEGDAGEATRVLARISSMSPDHRSKLHAFLERSARGPKVMPKRTGTTIALHEPSVSMSSDGRNLIVKWTDPRAFRRDWALHLSRGRLPAIGSPPHRRAFMMCVMMPDGYVTKFPAEIGETLRDGWLVRFLLPHGAYNRMRDFAEDHKRRVV